MYLQKWKRPDTDVWKVFIIEDYVITQLRWIVVGTYNHLLHVTVSADNLRMNYF